MKNLMILSLLNIFIQCQSQKINKSMIPIVDNRFEKFDIYTFNKLLSTDNSFAISQINNDVTEQLQKQSYGFIDRIFYTKSYFIYVKKYSSNYSIKEKGLLFNQGSQIGIWYYFDESGKLIKEENTDEGYDFTPEDVVKYCESHKIKLPKGYQDSGYKTSVYKKEIDGKKVWQISYVIAVGKEEFIEEIILDGKTGKLIKKKQVSYINN